ncbi:hypothetical protein SAMN05192571_10379 [Pleomorphomonas diazotrophica]|uniref:hypothetical protein n=1 Tax=Pleomorphomonas diazotrophica TaxID=1166257 RepID=UPI0008ECF0CD|nr:hypothetical protein [Pleomorphomonas diazotrophica]SFM60067.1 hypothetical protein SAMN05192571_10379 [Pleomorphomonas diazotrophica]
MDKKGLTLRHELPRLIEAAKALGASVLVMLLMSAEEELRRQEPEQRQEADHGLIDRS